MLLMFNFKKTKKTSNTSDFYFSSIWLPIEVKAELLLLIGEEVKYIFFFDSVASLASVLQLVLFKFRASLAS